MSKKIWTEKEIEVLEKTYPTKGGEFTSKILNKTLICVNKMASRLKLKCEYKHVFAEKNDITNAISTASSLADVLRKLNKKVCGANVNLLKKYCKLYDIEIILKQNNIKKNKNKCVEEYLISGSIIGSSSLKRKLYTYKIKQPICEICGQDENWNGNKMSLILDHINGINDDNRLENLRIVCPNCNATLPTHCRGYKRLNEMKKRVIEKNKIKEKKYEKSNLNNYSDAQMENSLVQRKIIRPPYNQLIEEINKLGYVGTGKKYGVSDNSIRKWKKFYEKYGT